MAMRPSRRPSPTAIRALAILTLLAIPCTGQDRAEPQPTLAAARTAVLGDRTSAPDLVATGTAEIFGIEGPLHLWIAADGRFRTRIDSKIGEQFCWDGERGFKVDMTGMPGTFGLEELDRFQLLLWVVGGHWLDAAAQLGLAVAPDPAVAGPPRILAHTAQRCLDGRITLDPTTHRPRTLDFAGHRELRPARDEHWQFDDYERVDGCWLPRRVVCIRGGNVTRLAVDAWRSLEAHDDSRFAAPVEPDDTRIESHASPEIAVRLLGSGHLAVQAEFGAERRWLILDTGASWSSITPAVVRELGLEPFAVLEVATPTGPVSARWVRARTMRVGPLRLMRNRLLVMPTPDFAAANRERPVGVLGYDFFRRAVMALDLGKGTLSLYPRDHEPDVSWLPLTFSGYVPYVEGELQGRFRGQFLLDLGDPNEVVLAHRFVAAHGLRADGGLAPPRAEVRSIDRYEPRRIDSLLVGTLHDRDLLALLARQPQRIYESAAIAGRLGLGYLRDARLWLDYGRARIAIERPR